jgi:DNA-binding CsgD family transcriptional regulator/tetratricopeptide (TPR) repeat protein
MELLERESFLVELNICLEKARAGNGCIALVSGESGIGKTSLVESFTSSQRKTFRILWGMCDSLFTPRPLGPLHDMAAALGGELVDLLATDSNPSKIFSAVLEELQRVPSIIVFEDVHWADEATLDLLRFIGRRISSAPALLVLTYRDDELGLQHPLRIVLGRMVSSAATHRIFLPPLSQQAVDALVGTRGMDANALHQRTGGNPFYITEVLASEGDGIPTTVRDAVLARAARLSPPGRSVLETAAVIGLRVEPRLLAEVTGAEAHGVEECLAVGMLRGQGEVLAFRHELERETILGTISPLRKYALHQRVLDALRSVPEPRWDLARLAHHAQASGDRQAVIEFAPGAARRASAAGAHREAVALYALMLRFAEDLEPADHALLLETYSRECNLVEQLSRAIAALQEALDIWRVLKNHQKQGAALAALTILLRNNGRNADAEQANQAAIKLLEPLSSSRELGMAYRARATLRLANRDYVEAITWGEKAIALAERSDDLFVQAMAHVAVGSAVMFQDYQRGCSYLERRLEVERETGQAIYIANIYTYLGACSVELYQFRKATQYLEAGLDYVSDRVLDIFRRVMLAWQSLALIHLGRWSDASEVLAQLLQSPAGSALRRIPALVALGRLRTRQGDPGAHDALEEALQFAGGTGTLPHLSNVHAARAEAAWLAGDRARTLEEAQAAYDLAVSKRHPWFTGELSFWRWRAGETVEVQDWMARPFRLQITGDWQAAAAEWERLGCPYEQARALADGDYEAQVAALSIFANLGAAPAEGALRQKLLAAGVAKVPRKPRTSTRDNPFGLTNRQVDVLSLLIEGLSNAEIASRLHISPKTADHHVSAVLAKLDVRSRDAAAELAQQHPHFDKK